MSPAQKRPASPDATEERKKPSLALDAPTLREEYTLATFTDTFRAAFLAGAPFSHPSTGASHAQVPFPHGLLPSLLPPAFIDRLCADIDKLAFTERSNDLYRFRQSSDLASLAATSAVSLLRETLYSPAFVQLMSSITGMDLDATADLSCHRYGPGDYLLCHDDDVRASSGNRGRRIAFILYLVPPTWSAADGGALDLYSSDENGLPKEVVKHLLPTRGTLAFFPISPTSHHEVAKVTSASDIRLSISGWFHGPLPTHTLPNPTISLPWSWAPPHPSPLPTADFIKPFYLEEKNTTLIQDRFIDESSLSLQDFLLASPDLSAGIQKNIARVDWPSVRAGPANVRRYSRLPGADATGSLSHLLHFLSSTPFITYLESITGLTLGSLHAEVLHFAPGDYSLLRDDIQEHTGLDLLCWLGDAPASAAKEWPLSREGQIVYVGGEDDSVASNELLSLWPSPALGDIALALRDTGVRRFIKRLQGTHAWSAISIVYQVIWDEEDEEDEEDDETDPADKADEATVVDKDESTA